MGRRLYWASFALTPIVLLAEYVFHVNGTVLFVLAAVALTPLAFLIGEATENLAEHTGEGIGGFLNASFGNAPELIIGVFAIGDGLPNVVRGTIAGSVVGTALIVFGVAIAYGGGGVVNRRSLGRQIGVMAIAVCLFLIPSIPGWERRPGPAQPLPPDAAGRSACCLILYVATTDAEPARSIAPRRGGAVGDRLEPPGRRHGAHRRDRGDGVRVGGARRVDHRVRRASSGSRSSSSPR